MNNELLTILEYIEQERGINREQLVGALEAAILSASKKSIHPANDITVKIDPRTGEIRAWAKLEVVDHLPTADQLIIARAQERYPDAKVGDIVDWEVTPRNFGRIAAQSAKQAIQQQLRKAEKEIVYAEFADRIGQIISGTVRRFDSGALIITFGKAEGILTSKEKIPGEQYLPGENIHAVLIKVDTEAAGPSLIVSRSHPDFVRALFEREVSEIHDGTVEIMGISREVGSRSKVAVKSNDERIDPVGACVGVRGTRVKEITKELGNERIDIVPWSSDIKQYAANALQPANIQSVTVNEAKRELVVHVTPEQSKLAFGKRAQNVRLSSKLIGWNINIQIEESAKASSLEDKIAQAVNALAAAANIDKITAEVLVSNGYLTCDDLREADAGELMNLPGIDADTLQAALDELDA
ncbi:MAG: transcription termination factor NusA [Lentisphaeria bacterium]|nr:transcription termination factor NusA [Lentisphaeria bacterium]